MIDTGTECNILLEELTREIGCVIHNVQDFRLSIATSQEFRFARIARIRLKIAKGVKYKNTFFLVKGASKILLG